MSCVYECRKNDRSIKSMQFLYTIVEYKPCLLLNFFCLRLNFFLNEGIKKADHSFPPNQPTTMLHPSGQEMTVQLKGKPNMATITITLTKEQKTKVPAQLA